MVNRVSMVDCMVNRVSMVDCMVDRFSMVDCMVDRVSSNTEVTRHRLNNTVDTVLDWSMVNHWSSVNCMMNWSVGSYTDNSSNSVCGMMNSMCCMMRCSMCYVMCCSMICVVSSMMCSMVSMMVSRTIWSASDC